MAGNAQHVPGGVYSREIQLELGTTFFCGQQLPLRERGGSVSGASWSESPYLRIFKSTVFCSAIMIEACSFTGQLGFSVLLMPNLSFGRTLGGGGSSGWQFG